MKEELGMPRFEGRSWRSFDHHVCLMMMVCGLLALEQLGAKHAPVAPGKKGMSSRRSSSQRSAAPCSGS
jgi:SRSO17 transposase